MCGRYVVISKLKVIEKRFRTLPSPDDLFSSNSNISIGTYAPVITNQSPQKIQLFKFGLTPFWAKKQFYTFNARSEGDHNKENDPNYKGSMGIIQKPMFRHAIRSQRCLVITDAFIEGPKKEKLSKPYLIYMRDGQHPFALAGIWDSWTDKSTGEIINSFAIITTTANDLLQKIGHHRSPVILAKNDEQYWLSDLPLSEVTDLLKPYPSDELNAYPISPEIKNPRNTDLNLLRPQGDRIYTEYDYEIYEQLKLEGMGMSRARSRKLTEGQALKEKSQKNQPPSLFDN